MRERRQESDELKAEAVKMVTRDGLSDAEVARRVGIPKATVGRWVTVLKEDTPPAWPGVPSMTGRLAENVRLRKELAHSKRDDHTDREHSSLGRLTPAEFKAKIVETRSRQLG